MKERHYVKAAPSFLLKMDVLYIEEGGWVIYNKHNEKHIRKGIYL